MPSLQSHHRSLPMLFLIYGFSVSILLLPLATVAAANANAVGGVEMLDQERADAQKEEILLDQTLKEAFDLAQRTLGEYNTAKSKLLSVSNNILESKDQKDGLGEKIQAIEDMKEEVSNKTEDIDKRIRDINAQQILDLKGKVEKLRDRELQRREKLKEKEETDKRRQRKLELKREKLKKKHRKNKKIPHGAVKKDELNDLLDVKAIVRESDEKLEEWCVKLVDEEVEAMQQELEDGVIESTTALGELGEKTRNDFVASDGCSGASLVEAVQLVQQSLVNYSRDVVGMVDHLEKATIVHFLTSDNYVPESKFQNPLEDMAWFQYLPDDWERGLDAVLPKGWRRWNIAIPDYVYHTFGLHKYAATAPPEAILTPHLYPGTCWPMKGTSGHVTLRLPYPVKVTAVTLDHAPASMFAEEDGRNSAPKKVRVFGYPPCWIPVVGTGTDSLKGDYLDGGSESDDDDVEHVRGLCADGLDFDVQKPIVLHHFEYNMTGPSIQTFQIPLEDEEEEEEEEEDESSCSEETGTCGGSLDDGSCSEDTGTCAGGMDLDAGTNDIMVSTLDRSDTINEGISAIRLQVLDNWGNADYTCIYRFRIHGDIIDPSDD